MEIRTLLRNSFNLFHSSLITFLPFILIGTALGFTLFHTEAFDTLVNAASYETFSWENTVWGMPFPVFLGVLGLLSCLASFIFNASLLFIAYYQQQDRRVPYLSILQQAIAKAPSFFALLMALMWPLMAGACIVLLITFLPAIGLLLFGSPSSAPSGSSINLLVSFIELLGSLIMIIAALYSTYSVLLHFRLAQANMIIHNMGFWKSIKRSKELVRGRKIYVLIISFFFYLLPLVGNTLFGHLFSICFGWLVLLPFEACLGIAIYQQLAADNR